MIPRGLAPGKFIPEQKIVVIDLGGGSGIFLEKILTKYKNAFCYWIDSSEPFYEIAQEKLAKFEPRVKFVLSRLEEPWENEVAGKADFIFSMSAIHHLEQQEKKDLYQRIFNKLGNNGRFFNIDEMKTFYDDAYKQSLLLWSKYVREQAGKMTETEIPFYEEWCKQFKQWEIRNIEQINEPKLKGDDLHENFIAQIQWLKDSGFVNVDLFLKYHLWGVIGGKKHE